MFMDKYIWKGYDVKSSKCCGHWCLLMGFTFLVASVHWFLPDFACFFFVFKNTVQFLRVKSPGVGYLGHRISQGWHQLVWGCILIRVLNPFQSHLCCRQDLVSCSCRTDAPVFLQAVSLVHSQLLETALGCSHMAPSTSAMKKHSHIESFLSFTFLSFLLLPARENCLLLKSPIWLS